MINDNAKAVIAALRSGEYKQTSGCLHDTEGYCCLGVACDVYRKQTGEGKWVQTNVGSALGFQLDGLQDSEKALLPLKVKEWLGFDTESGDYGADGADDLATKNDMGESFEKIAEIIESEPEGLFA